MDEKIKLGANKPTEDAVAAEWRVGDVILDLYEVTGILGEGGMGKVYKVHHKGWNVDLAVKSPKPAIFTQATGKENFVREAETWVNLGLHPHIVSCYYVRTLGGIPRVFAEYVDGGSLADWIRSRKLYEGGTEKALERILDVAIQFAWGLQYAHEQGLVHQDVKPDNVMMTADGTVKVADFGLSKARGKAGEKYVSGSGNSILVSAGLMTLPYCSPEQHRGDQLSHRTDIWSWGVSVWEMFCGELYVCGRGYLAAGVFEDFLEAEDAAGEIPLMPEALAGLLRRCFQRDPTQRPRYMADVASELKEIYQQVIGTTYPRQAAKAAEALADSLNNWAVSMLDLGKTKEALSTFAKVLSLDAHHPEALLNSTQLEATLQQMDVTSAVAKLSPLMNTSYGDQVRLALGLAHLEVGTTESAVSLLSQCAAANSSDALYWRTLAPAKLLQKSSLDALTDEAAQARLRSDWCAQANLAAQAFRTNDRDAAVLALQRACTLHPADPHLWIDFATACCGSGRYEEALQALARALALSQTMSERAERLARTLKEKAGLIMPPDLKTPAPTAAANGGYPDLFATLCPRNPAVFLAGDSVVIAPNGRWCAWGQGNDLVIYPVDEDQGIYCLSLARVKDEYDRSQSGGGISLKGHESSIMLVACSADGRTLISGDLYGTICVWKGGLRITDWHRVKIIPTDYQKDLHCMASSPDGRRMFTGGNKDGKVLVWDLESYTCIGALEGLRLPAQSIVLSADGSICAAADIRQTVAAWQLPSGKPIIVNAGSKRDWDRDDYNAPLAIIPTGTYVLVRGGDPTRLDAVPFASNGPSFALHGHRGQITAASFLNVRYCVSGDDQGIVKVWDVKQQRCLRTLTSEYTTIVKSISCSRKRGLCLVSHGALLPELWQIDFTDNLPVLPRWTQQYFITRPRPANELIQVQENVERRLLAVGDLIESRRWQDAYTECRALQELPERKHDLEIMRRLWRLASQGRRIRVRDAWLIRQHYSGEAPPDRVTFSPDGHWYARSTKVGSVAVWDVPTGADQREFYKGSSFVQALALFPFDPLCLIGKEHEMFIWNYQQDTIHASLEVDQVSDAALSSDGKHVFTGHRDGSVCCWDTASLSQQWRRKGIRASSVVTSVVTNPQQPFCACGYWDGEVVIWQTNGVLVGYLPKAIWSEERSSFQLQGPTRLAFSSCGRFLAVIKFRDSAEIWRLDYAPQSASSIWSYLTRIVGKTAPIRNVVRHEFNDLKHKYNDLLSGCAFSPDSRFLVYAFGNTLAITPNKTMEKSDQPYFLRGHSGEVMTVAFSPDGSRLLSGADDHQVRLWAIDWELAFD